MKKIGEADNLTVKEFAEIVDLTPQAVLYWVRQGESYFANKAKQYTGEYWTYERGVSPASEVTIKRISEENLPEGFKEIVGRTGDDSMPRKDPAEVQMLGDILKQMLEQIKDLKDEIRDIRIEKTGGATSPLLSAELIKVLAPIAIDYMKTRSEEGARLLQAFQSGFNAAKKEYESYPREHDSVDSKSELIQTIVENLPDLWPIIQQFIPKAKHGIAQKISGSAQAGTHFAQPRVDGGVSDESATGLSNDDDFTESPTG